MLRRPNCEVIVKRRRQLISFIKRRWLPLAVFILFLAFAMHQWRELFFEDDPAPAVSLDDLPDGEVLGQQSGNSNAIFGDNDDTADGSNGILDDDSDGDGTWNLNDAWGNEAWQNEDDGDGGGE